MTQPNSAQNGTENRLTPRQETVALALARGASVREAAEASGAGMRTVKTWTGTLPAFTRRVHELRAEMTAQALGQLVAAMAGAARTLHVLCRSGQSEMVRLSAARSIIEMGTRLRESIELEERLTLLEQAQAARERHANQNPVSGRMRA
jgi:hypothetical protein